MLEFDDKVNPALRGKVLPLEHLVTIELFGQPYTFKTESEFYRAKEVADYLAKEVARVENLQSKQASRLNQTTIMIMAALNIIKDYLELQQERNNLLQELNTRSADLIQKLDQCCVQSGSEFAHYP
jgi:cell division protein ZapA (FtsZ GTPase activity inhibitor)